MAHVGQGGEARASVKPITGRGQSDVADSLFEEARAPLRFVLFLGAMLAMLAHCRYAAADPSPSLPEEVDVIEHLGDKVSLNLTFIDHDGNPRRLGDYFVKDRPVVLALVYYECPMLCSLVSRSLVRAMRSVGLDLGRDYEAITVSFDPADAPKAAALKRGGYLEALDRHGADPVWPFLVGNTDSIKRLTDELGFRYSPVPGSRELAHAAVVFVLSPEGTISRYLYGVDFPPRDLRLALVEASAGRVGTSFDRVLMRCYRYDPVQRRYALFVSNYMRAGGVLTLLIAGGLLFRMWRREYGSARPLS